MIQIFKTPVVSQRHVELGFCENSDFATIELSVAEPVEVEFIFSHLSEDIPPIPATKKVIKYNRYYYQNILRLPFSRDDDKFWMKKNGKFSTKTAINLMLKIRESHCNQYSCVYDSYFILIGRTLYQRWCKIKDLCITTTGNMLFGQWFSIDIESRHCNKINILLTKKNYFKALNKAKKYFNKNKVKGREKEQFFSYPKSLKWGSDI